ncbi:hypothetical protein L1987_34392 [Smallanthus sonchifolius]|uniref:Uncharacterized protein n=1 Tax=Smallanthus sonchifolius TaxID=185202 RepID=A0ACB9HTD9_9ASTR|nr:hypothetical protein L1987_34392 [Smallanthus sonchifolius]
MEVVCQIHNTIAHPSRVISAYCHNCHLLVFFTNHPNTLWFRNQVGLLQLFVRIMDSVVATVSGYHGSERFKLIKLISQAGASYVGAMNSSTTHLVCHKFEGKKYELARKFKTIVVNHRWIEDCIKQGRRVSERPYMKQCGFEVGLLLLEIPNAANEVRSAFGEVSTTRNFSKTPVIDIECGDDAWTDSWLLKEVRCNLFDCSET